MRSVRVGVAGAAVIVVVLTGCSGSSAPSSAKTTTSTTLGAQEAKDQLGAARSEACLMDYRTLQTAIEAYRAFEGSEPTKVADLVPGYLRDASHDWEVVGQDANGEVQLAPTAAGRKAGCKAPADG